MCLQTIVVARRLASVGLLLFCASPGHASTTYVSVTGSDSSACASASAPCLTIKHAMAEAEAGKGYNRVVLLNAGIFKENVVIAKPMEIVGDGAHFQAIGPTSGTAVKVVAGLSDVVHFANFQFAGNSGAVEIGLDVLSMGALDLEHVEFHGFSTAAIMYEPNTANYPVMSLNQSLVADAGSSGAALVEFHPTVGGANLLIRDSQLRAGHIGLLADMTGAPNSTGGAANLILKNVDVFDAHQCVELNSASANAGIKAEIRSSGLYCGAGGLQASGSGVNVILNGATIEYNGTGYAISGGATAQSFGNNNLANNGQNVGALTAAELQ